MTAKQWIGLGVTLAVVAGVHLCVYLTRSHLSRLEEPEQFVMLPEMEEAFQQYVDSIEQAEYARRYPKHPKPSSAIILQPFDPNTADSTLLVTVGLKPYMARNLIRYREAGKIFRRPDDMRTLYGMSDSLFASLRPYIQIDSALVGSLESRRRAVTDSLSVHYRSVYGSTTGVDSVFASTHPKRDTVIELNSADTSSLQFIRGIGRYTAVSIVRYRQQLGGFVSTKQLREISGIPSERIDSMLPHLIVDTSLVTPIAVNRASVKQLYRHPYIPYRQAEQVYDLRRRRIRLKGINELSEIFTPDELRRLAPYLSFE